MKRSSSAAAKPGKTSVLLWLAIFVCTAMGIDGRLSAQGTGALEVIGYVFPQQPTAHLLTPAEIDASQLTRVNYAFAQVQEGRVVEGTPNDAANFAALRALRASQPRLKLVVSVGGWLGSGGFSEAAHTAAARRTFAESALSFVQRYDLDGLDLDWEYPGQAGAGNRYRPEDGANFNLLLRDLRTRFDANTANSHKHLLLTIAAGASLPYLQHTRMGEAQRYLDQINLMAYDFYEPADTASNRTGNHAPLFADPADPQKASAAAMVQAFEQAGVPAAKLVLGVPFYGHAWGNVAPDNHGLFQRGEAAVNLRTGYTDVQSLLSQGFTRYWDDVSQVPWAYNSSTRQFISYEDPESLARKAAFILQQKLGGAMFWQYFSDPSGVLLHTLHTALSSPRQSSENRP